MKSLIILILTFFNISLFAEALLQDVKTYRTDKAFVTELQFNENLQSEDVIVDYINQTIQVNIPQAGVAEGKRRDKVSDDKVKSVYTYQTDKGLRTRIIYKKPTIASSLEGLFAVDKSKNTLKLIVYNEGKKPLPEKLVALPNVKPFDLNKEVAPEKKEDKKAINKKTAKIVNAKLVLDKEMNEVKTIKKQEITRVLTKKEINNLKESEIPVLATIKAKKSKSSPNHIRAIVSVLLVLATAFGLYLFSKWWSVKHQKTMSGNEIRVIHQHHLGPKKSLMIVRVAGETLLLGNTEQSINLIKPLALLEEDSLSQIDEKQSFSDTLTTNIKTHDKVSRRASVPQPNTYSAAVDNSADQFSMTRVKSLVGNKLKDMRNI